jgi:hypothetical protein
VRSFESTTGKSVWACLRRSRLRVCAPFGVFRASAVVRSSPCVVCRGYCIGDRLSLGYLVDPASSHMLVSKIKPCMSKYKRLYCETANGSLNQLWFI